MDEARIGETPGIVSTLHSLLIPNDLKKGIEDYLERCRLVYLNTKHGGWESLFLSFAMFKLAENLKDCRILFSPRAVQITESPERERKIADTYEKILKAPVPERIATQIDALAFWRDQQCLIEHETHWKGLSASIVRACRVFDIMKSESSLSTSCIFITHASIHKYQPGSNPITKFIQYAQTCEGLFGTGKWAIVVIWDSNFDWRLQKIDVWWIPKDFPISRLEEKEKESLIPSFWKKLGRLQ